MTTLFDDTYTGPRWTYGLTYRPLGYAQVPDGWIVFSNRDHPDFRFGTVDYPNELHPDTVRQTQLTLVDSPPDGAGNWLEVLRGTS